MRTWSLCGRVVVILGLIGGVAAAKDVPPPELLVTVALGPDSTLDSVRAFADTVRPGTGAVLTAGLVRQGLGELTGADSLDGLDPTAATYVLLVDGGPTLRGAAVVGKVRDDKALTSGAGQAQVVIDHGWAVIGSDAIVKKVASYAFAHLPSRLTAGAPSAVVYVPQVLKRYRTEIEGVRTQVGAQLGAMPGAAALSSLTQSYLDGLYSVVADSEQLVVTLDVTKEVGAIDLALTPRAGTRLAKFVAAQRATDYALLAKLPATQAPMLMAGHVDSGPYRAGMVEMFSSIYGRGGKAVTDAMTAIMKASTGDIAVAMAMGTGKPMAITQVFGIADKAAMETQLDHLRALFKAGLTIDNVGISTSIKTSASTVDHDGVSLRRYDITYDYAAAPAATRAAMEQMLPGGTTTAHVGTVDRLALVTFGAGDPAAAIDAAHGKTGSFTPSAALAGFLAGSVARKESFLMSLDVGALMGKPGSAPSMILSCGFADRTAHLRGTVSAASLRTIAAP